MNEETVHRTEREGLPQPTAVPGQPGVPAYTVTELAPRAAKYCLRIPICSEGQRILLGRGWPPAG